MCFRVMEAARKRLEALLAEHTTDPYTRQRLRQANGLCATHTWLLATVTHANLGVALIYHDLLRDILAQLEQAAPQTPSGMARKSARVPRWTHDLSEATCLVCREGDGLTASDLGVIVGHFDEPGFLAGFARSAGLCLPHLRRLADCAAGHPNLGRMLEWHVARWTELDLDLVEFARKFDYR